MTVAPVPTFIPEPAAPSNFGSRGGQPVDMIVIHTTQDDRRTRDGKPSAIPWFQDKDSQASAHFVIAQDGTVYQCVPLSSAAFHAGNGFFNRRSIGIECEGLCERPETWTVALVASLTALVRYLTTSFQVPADRQHIIGHDEVPDPKHPGLFGGLHHHTDPGRYCPWAVILQAAQGAASVA